MYLVLDFVPRETLFQFCSLNLLTKQNVPRETAKNCQDFLTWNKNGQKQQRQNKMSILTNRQTKYEKSCPKGSKWDKTRQNSTKNTQKAWKNLYFKAKFAQKVKKNWVILQKFNFKNRSRRRIWGKIKTNIKPDV